MVVSDNKGIWYAVVNIFAASKKAGSMWRRAERQLVAESVQFCSEMTGDHGNAMNLTCVACEKGFRNFIAVGGDGTVHDVLEGIVFFIESRRLVGDDISLEDFALAVIPVGSGNDWIKTTGVPKDIVKAASLLSSGRLKKQDVVKVSILDPSSLPEEKSMKVVFMANVGGVGLDARVCEKVNKEKSRGKRGKSLYVRALIYNIIHRVPAFARVFCDGKKVFEGAYLSMAFGIGKYSGGGMRQTPDAVMDDGMLDMTVIPDLPIMTIAKEAPKLFTGNFLTVKELTSARGRGFIIVPYDPEIPCHVVNGELVEVDGEVVGRAPVKLEVMDGQLNILCPDTF